MSWRPKEGWEENLLKVTYHSMSMEIYDKREVKLGREFFAKGCEVGADAMLEAVKEHVVNVGKEVGRDDLEFRIRVAAWLCR